MSSHSYSGTCPVCEGDLDLFQTNRPFEQISGQCNECGFGFTPKTYRASFEELNEWRRDHELPKLSEEEYNQHNKSIKDYI